jgi:hypothetical protein
MRLNLVVQHISQTLTRTQRSTGVLRRYVTQLCQQAAMPTGSYVTPITRLLCHAAMPTGSSTGSYVTPITRLSPLGLLCYIHYHKIINIYILLFSLRHASQTPHCPRIQATKFSICVAACPKNMWPQKKKYLNPLTHTLAY